MGSLGRFAVVELFFQGSWRSPIVGDLVIDGSKGLTEDFTGGLTLNLGQVQGLRICRDRIGHGRFGGDEIAAMGLGRSSLPRRRQLISEIKGGLGGA